MAKVLVDTQTDEIRGYYEEPLDFSVSGRYILDVPVGLYPTTQAVADIISRKIDWYKSQHPSLTNYEYDELLTTPNVDTANAAGYFLGPNKRTEIMGPGGYFYTNPIAIASPPANVLIHLYGFTLYSDPGPVVTHPAPNRLLYNYDSISGFFNFDPSVFQVKIVDAGTLAELHTFTGADVEEPPNPGPLSASIRLRFTNTDTVRWHLSDWVFLYG